MTSIDKALEVCEVLSGAPRGMSLSDLARALRQPAPTVHRLLAVLKKRGYVERMGNGYVAITADGIDKLGSDDLALPADRLIADRSAEGTPAPQSSRLLVGATAS